MPDAFSAARIELRERLDGGSALCKQLLHSLTQAPLTRHPYGFFVMRCGSHSGADLRIHAWLDVQRMRQEPDWPPHTHPGPILSFVIAGCVRNRVWNVVRDRLGTHTVYQVSYSGEESVLKRTKRLVRVQPASETQICAGECYEVPAKVFHDSDVAPGERAVTVVWMRRFPGTESSVIGDRNGPREIRFRRTEVTASEVLAAKQVIGEALGVERWAPCS
jgi:hypothetical protein